MKRKRNKSAVSRIFSFRRPGSLDRHPRPMRYPLGPRRLRFILFSLAALVLVVIASVTVFGHWRPAPVSAVAAKLTLKHTPTPTTTPTPSSIPTPTPTPTSIPTSTPIPTPTPTPLVLPATQTSVLCNPTSLTSGAAQLAGFGGDVSDNCGGQFFYNPLPTSLQEHYVLHLSLPPEEALDYCNVYGYIPSIHASAQNMRNDLFVNNVWLGWGNFHQDSSKGWQDIKLNYPIHATGNITIDVQVSDGIDQSGELAWTTLKFVCQMVSTSS